MRGIGFVSCISQHDAAAGGIAAQQKIDYDEEVLCVERVAAGEITAQQKIEEGCLSRLEVAADEITTQSKIDYEKAEQRSDVTRRCEMMQDRQLC